MRKRGERSGEESGRRRTEREYEINREKKGTAGRVVCNIFLSLLILVLACGSQEFIFMVCSILKIIFSCILCQWF